MQDRPLEGIRVVDYSHFLAGPYVGRCLVALGADVIKVERPGSGDPARQHATVLPGGQSGYFLQLNMGKRGLSVNLKDPRGRDLTHLLCDSADVFVENYRPGALERLGLGDQAEAGAVGVRAGVAVGRDRAVDQPRVASRELGVAEAEPLQGPGAVVLDEHVGGVAQAVHQIAAARVLQVHAEAALAHVQLQEVAALPAG